MPSSSALPQKSLRASSQAIAMPNGSATTVATTAIRSDSGTAVHSSGVREKSTVMPAKAGIVDAGANGSPLRDDDDAACIRRRPHQEREAVLLEHRLGDAAAQESEIRGGLGLGVRGRGDRIDDRRDASRPGRRRRSSRSARPWRRSRTRCRARLRRARPAPARRAHCRPSRTCSRTEAQMPSFSSALLAYLPTGTEFTSPVAMRPSPISLARSKP